MAKVKYLGSADRRVLPKGTNFGGRLAEPTEKEVVFSRDNYFVVDTDEAGLSADAVALLLKEPDFKDVTDAKRLPLSAHEKTFGGFPGVDVEEEVLESDGTPEGGDKVEADAPDGAVNDSGTAEVPGGSDAAGGPTTTVGGSTAGATGTAGGGTTGRGSTRGGSR